MLNGLSLFSGIGGIDIALSEWVRPVAYCEIEPYAAAVLFSRMADGSLPAAPIFPDIRELTAAILPSIDIVYGGSPCQGLSQAGMRQGFDDERSELFFEQLRLVRETQADFLFWENVGNCYQADVATAARAIETIGYTARAGSLSAADVGAPHNRRRIWLLAYRNGIRQQSRDDDGCCSESGEKKKEQPTGLSKAAIWNGQTISEALRVDDGVFREMDRIKCLGNAVVPQCAKAAFERLMGVI